MGRESTLKRIDSEIAAGDLGKARDRLHGLMATYPDDLVVRSRLGEVYWKLQYPSRAGCYWYLDEPHRDEMRAAVESFEARCGGDPWMMLSWLKFRGDPDNLPSASRRRLQSLIGECKRTYGRYPEFRGNRQRVVETAKGRATVAIPLIGCVAILMLVGACAIVGIVTIVRWFL